MTVDDFDLSSVRAGLSKNIFKNDTELKAKKIIPKISRKFQQNKSIILIEWISRQSWSVFGVKLSTKINWFHLNISCRMGDSEGGLMSLVWIPFDAVDYCPSSPIADFIVFYFRFDHCSTVLSKHSSLWFRVEIKKFIIYLSFKYANVLPNTLIRRPSSGPRTAVNSCAPSQLCVGVRGKRLIVICVPLVSVSDVFSKVNFSLSEFAISW